MRCTLLFMAALAPIALIGAPANADLTTGLAGLWTFETAGDLADDSSPYDNDGVVILGAGDSSIVQGPGIIGAGAAEFSASDPVAANHYIEIPGDQATAPQLNGTSQTVSYWIKTTYTSDDPANWNEAAYVDHIRHSGHMSFKTTGTNDTPGGWAPITFDAGGGYGNSFNDNNIGEYAWTGTETTEGYADGEWHHIVTVYDETTNTLKTWIDLELVVDQVQTHLAGGLNPTSEPLKIGGWDGWGASVVGSMDQVRIYDMAKSYAVDADGTLIGGDLHEMYMEVPEPASLMLLSLAGVALLRRR